MFSKTALFFAATMAVLITASPEGSCNTGPVQCCNSMHKEGSASRAALLTAIGVNAQDITGDIGAQCSPITAVGAGGGTNCGSSPVCCSNNSFNGVVAIGCSPINVNI